MNNYNNNRDSGVKNKGNEAQNQAKPATNASVGGFNKYITVAVIAFIVGLGLGLAITKNPSPEDKKIDVYSSQTGDLDQKDSLSTDNIVWPEVPANILNVVDQAAGLQVNIEKANVPKSVWVAIHEDNGAGAPGNILGAQLFDVGMTSGAVQLLRATESGKIYYAMIHDDNGDRAFLPKMDVPVVDAEGKPIMFTFKTTALISPTN
ncbi:MAG TPA: hypothetical protein VJI33_02700 [Candidatus Paceibacterota bacterium]